MHGFMNYKQNDRKYWLAIDEFVENTDASEATNLSLLLFKYGFHSHFSTDLVSFRHHENQHERTLAKALWEVNDIARKEIL